MQHRVTCTGAADLEQSFRLGPGQVGGVLYVHEHRASRHDLANVYIALVRSRTDPDISGRQDISGEIIVTCAAGDKDAGLADIPGHGKFLLRHVGTDADIARDDVGGSRARCVQTDPVSFARIKQFQKSVIAPLGKSEDQFIGVPRIVGLKIRSRYLPVKVQRGPGILRPDTYSPRVGDKRGPSHAEVAGGYRHGTGKCFYSADGLIPIEQVHVRRERGVRHLAGGRYRIQLAVGYRTIQVRVLYGPHGN